MSTFGVCGKCGQRVTGMGHLAECYVMKIEIQNESLHAKLGIAIEALEKIWGHRFQTEAFSAITAKQALEALQTKPKP